MARGCGSSFTSQACDNYDHKISTKKTEVVYQLAPGKTYREPTITVNGTKTACLSGMRRTILIFDYEVFLCAGVFFED